eukprot:2050388-Prorocentrum_lima.AAC.1
MARYGEVAMQWIGGLAAYPWRLGPFVFCIRCGAYSQLRTVSLLRPCPGLPANHAARARLAHLLRGEHPRLGHSIGTSAPLRDSAGDRPEEPQ